jgi:hypothetical protein
MQKTILYLSHGGQKYHDQTRYSVLTLLALLLAQNRNDVRIVVCTDRPDQLPAHDLVKALYVSREDFAAWRGPLDYVHRIKLGILRCALEELGAPLIYVDSDTRWLNIPDAPFAALSREAPLPGSAGVPSASSSFHENGRDARGPGATRPTCYLYRIEGAISPNFFPQYFHLLRKSRHRLATWRLPHDPPWTMWNSGTVGIPSRSAGFIDDVLRVNDALLPHVGFRNCVEQLALSLVAASRFDVRPFDAYLEHWWSYGSELPVYLRRFFDPLPPGLPITEQATRAAQFRIAEAELRAIQRQPANRVVRWCAKVRNSFYKRKIDLRAFSLRRRAAAIENVD